MTKLAADPIEYATTLTDPPADRLLRRVLGFVCIGYAGNSLVAQSFYVAMAKGWLAGPSSMSWSLDRADVVTLAFSVAAMTTLVIGGVSVLKRGAAGVWLIRSGLAASILVTLGGTAAILINNPSYRSMWSTPGAGIAQTLGVTQRLWPEVLVGLLTLPTFSRRWS